MGTIENRLAKVESQVRCRRRIVAFLIVLLVGGISYGTGSGRAVADTPLREGENGVAITGPTKDGVRRLLMKFLRPNVDKASLMRSLRPSPEDYRIVYKAPFAGKLETAHRSLWESGETIGGKPGQTELLLFFAMTDDLIDRAQISKYFPGGYRRISQYLKRGFPIVRFKFVRPGRSLGMAYDGLVYVRNRWVFMPKPWRVR